MTRRPRNRTMRRSLANHLDATLRRQLRCEGARVPSAPTCAPVCYYAPPRRRKRRRSVLPLILGFCGLGYAPRGWR